MRVFAAFLVGLASPRVALDDPVDLRLGAGWLCVRALRTRATRKPAVADETFTLPLDATWLAIYCGQA